MTLVCAFGVYWVRISAPGLVYIRQVGNSSVYAWKVYLQHHVRLVAPWKDPVSCEQKQYISVLQAKAIH